MPEIGGSSKYLAVGKGALFYSDVMSGLWFSNFLTGNLRAYGGCLD